MTNEELSQTLNRLQEQLAENPQLDEATLQSLRALLDEIEAATLRSQAARAAQGAAADETAEELSLSQRLRKSVEDFEFRHPQLTVTLSQIADSLAEMGI